MPKGMSFCGLRASEAAVETVSNPKYAKNRIEAARSTVIVLEPSPHRYAARHNRARRAGRRRPAPTAPAATPGRARQRAPEYKGGATREGGATKPGQDERPAKEKRTSPARMTKDRG